ncbi:hypothetical protein ACQBAR_10525 [Propionibacteriaceae bacterium Y1685]|uniref:hypothetical protein n=1 Tax=Microlunatus sp. Y1700 TaxID=3418487 RepID=UPI003B787CAA
MDETHLRVAPAETSGDVASQTAVDAAVAAGMTIAGAPPSSAMTVVVVSVLTGSAMTVVVESVRTGSAMTVVVESVRTGSAMTVVVESVRTGSAMTVVVESVRTGSVTRVAETGRGVATAVVRSDLVGPPVRKGIRTGSHASPGPA